MGDYVQYMYVHTKESEQSDTMCLEAEILMQKLEIGGWGGRGVGGNMLATLALRY